MRVRPWVAVGLFSALVAVVVVFVLALLLIKLLWFWTIPDLLPGAVDQGLVARDISWMTSLKLALFVALLASVTGLRRGRR